MEKKIDLKFGIIVGLIVLAALSRLMPHPPNFTPIGGMALFGAAYFTHKRWAFIIPLVALFFSDLLINNIVYPILYPEYYQGFTIFSSSSLYVYGAFIVIVLMGMGWLKQIKVSRLLLGALGASVAFFLITNFGAWLSNPLYSNDFSGLLLAYEAGIPFFWNTLAGDLLFTGLLFGSYSILQNSIPQLKPALAEEQL